jgi:outer membrane protein assembly factor BamB
MRAQTGGPIAATPTVGGGNVYVGSWDGYEYAYRGKSGSRLWRTYLGRTYDGNCGYGLATLGITSAARLEDHTRTSAAAISAGTRSRRAVAGRCGGLARLPMRWGAGITTGPPARCS